MNPASMDRREFLTAVGVGAAAVTLEAEALARVPALLKVDPTERHALSPYLYMQFMEPLGTTDSSVDAAWDFLADRWRPDLVEVTRTLGPTLMRWGGCFISYYRWQEGVGPRDRRPPMVNLLWGGVYQNQVGTHEFVDFCRQVGADPLIVVNFESDGHREWARNAKGQVRTADAAEAREWVAYCNDPAHALRRAHGRAEPYGVKLWQIGNETSYVQDGFTAETAARKTVEFAQAMRQADPSIQLIGWGEEDWARPMAEIAGEHLQYLAWHNGFGPGGPDSPLRGVEYRKDPDRTWDHFMRRYREPAGRIDHHREIAGDLGLPFALTEGHFILPGRNRCEALSTWAAGVANARILNVFERNGDLVKIATLADFCGTRWQNNAVMLPVPWGKAFLMPVAMVMSLYRHHTGTRYLEVPAAPDGLDVTASRDGDRVFLHVINTQRTRDVTASLAVDGRALRAGRVHWFDVDPEHEVFEYHDETIHPAEAPLPADGKWTFPAASVSAVELDLEA